MNHLYVPCPNHLFQRFGQYVKKYFNCTSWRKRRWLTIFPEGGFKYKRVHNSKKFAQKNNLTELEYCTYPRHYGIHAAIQVSHFVESLPLTHLLRMVHLNIFWMQQLHIQTNAMPILSHGGLVLLKLFPFIGGLLKSGKDYRKINFVMNFFKSGQRKKNYSKTLINMDTFQRSLIITVKTSK